MQILTFSEYLLCICQKALVTFHKLAYFILSQTIHEKYYYFSQFAGKKVEA